MIARSDTPTGFDRAPDRYTAHGRETIDRMRDLAYERAADLLVSLGKYGPDVTRAAADALFAYHCDATAMKYADREGLKDAADQDRRKADFYRRMAAHVRGDGPDPRHERPNFTPYERP